MQDVGFSVENGELVSIIGPSGAGKTTLLKILAGLETPDAGELQFAVPPSKKNPTIMVFQDYVLFPNMTVFENTAFGLKARRIPKKEIRERVERILEFFHLEDKAGQYPAALSAGQQQRAAVARAMVVNPSLLLLDEPFANLDSYLKMEIAEFIRNTQQTFDITTISVTHDLAEAFVMSDKIGIMLEGRLVQYDTAGEVYKHPASYEAAGFMGPVNHIPQEYAEELGVDQESYESGKAVHARPEGFEIRPDSQGAGRIVQTAFAGHFIRYTVEFKKRMFTVYGLHDQLQPGDRVALSIVDYFTSDEEIV